MPAEAKTNGHPVNRITHYMTAGINCLIFREGDLYWAAFNNGLTEQIDPIDGQPRPVPDLATKTKGYKVPSQLRAGNGTAYKASKYTGTMRLAAGSYHSKGQNSPFKSDGNTVTHGIFKAMVVIETVLVAKYWVVEISPDGVFAAPITPGLWSVSAYLQTPTSMLDLKWAFLNKPPTLGIKRLLDDITMSVVWSLGTPWGILANGWAFSYTGSEAQLTFYRQVTTPAIHFLCSRRKLVFVVGGVWPEVVLAADLQALETDEPATFHTDSAVWWMTSFSGTTEGASSFSAFPYLFWDYPSWDDVDNPALNFPTQDAPIFVYYEGDVERVVRWKLTRVEVNVDNPLLPTFPAEVIRGEVDAGFAVIPWCRYSPLGPSTRNFNYVNVTSGFVCTSKFDHIKLSNNVQKTRTHAATAPTVVGSDAVVTTGSCSTVTETSDWEHFFVTQAELEKPRRRSSSIVLLLDREACLAVSKEWVRDTNILKYPTDPVTEFDGDMRNLVNYKIVVAAEEGCSDVVPYPYEVPGTPHCTLVDSPTEPPGATTPEGGGTWPTIPSPVVTETISNTGAVALCLGGEVVTDTFSYTNDTYPLHITPVASNLNLGCFVSLASSASSNVEAMHGNLFYPDFTLTPSDQKTNAVYRLGGAVTTVGGFVRPSGSKATVGFVGKA